MFLQIGPHVRGAVDRFPVQVHTTVQDRKSVKIRENSYGWQLCICAYNQNASCMCVRTYFRTEDTYHSMLCSDVIRPVIVSDLIGY